MALTENPTDAELVRLGIDAAMSRMFKAGPGIVRAYDPITNTAFVAPAIRHAVYSTDDERSFEDLPEIPFVPVIFPRAGGFVFRTPVSPGDSVLLVYCDASLAEWREQGGKGVEPTDARRHSLGWPVAIPGFFPDSSPMSSIDGAAAALQMIVGQIGGSQMRVGPTGIEFANAGITPLTPVALAPSVTAFMTAVAAWIALASPKIIAMPAPLTDPEKTALGVAAGTVATTGAPTAVALVPSTLVRSV